MEDTSEEQQKAITWLWVVEGLATMNHVDVSVLQDLMGEIGSALPEHISRNARERVALRCLEELFGSSNNGFNSHVASSQNCKISIDLSESCESVLKRVTNETPESDLRNGGPGLLRWDVHPFIVHKKATLPKCALKQLKDSILDGSHPHADVLREKSGLSLTSDVDRVLVYENNESLNKSCSSAQNLGVDGKSENGNILLSERDRIGSNNNKRERVNDSDDCCIKAKKMNLDASHVSQSVEVEQNGIPIHGKECLQDMSERHVPVSVNGRCDVPQNSVKGGHSDYAASKIHGQSSDVAIQKNQTENDCNPTPMPKDTFQDKCYQHSCLGEVKDDGGLRCILRVSNDAPLGEIQQKISDKGINCNREHDTHIRVPLLSSMDEPQQLRKADEGNIRGPEYIAGENVIKVNHSDDVRLKAKRKEWDAYYVLHSIEQNQLPLNSEDSSEREVPVSERSGCDVTENQMEMMEEVRVLEDSRDDYTESKRKGQHTHDSAHESQLENCCKPTPMPQDIIRNEACQHTYVDKRKDDSELQLGPRITSVDAAEGSQHLVPANVFNDNTGNDVLFEVLHPAATDGAQQKSLANKRKDDNDHCSKPSSSGVASLNENQQKNSTQQSARVSEHDSHVKAACPASIDEYQLKSIDVKSKLLKDFHDKKIDAAMKKHAFWRSQCTSSHDSFETTVTEKIRSLNCNESGQLLTCKTSTCPVVVRENWLRSSAMSFEKDNFYCPFCSYSLALADYLETKNKNSLVEPGLNAFVHANLEDQPMATTQSSKKKALRTVEEEEMLKKQKSQCNEETRVPWKKILDWL
ncbi:uncharacterized protein LOC126798064 [Argentina anserina]|uniref:uncharacterized protein LOC126798064 n=1 Tax=Argentina anserina TaxID=57926 RepID=UPI00217667DF|nr:uncharacterized protein LOC126798064 [Potentilla anserina]XP_050380847.1 uncharacterized protein LOC126798064 [Potentilla anserina]